jgi:hypothetical protein
VADNEAADAEASEETAADVAALLEDAAVRMAVDAAASNKPTPAFRR